MYQRAHKGDIVSFENRIKMIEEMALETKAIGQGTE
jgi:hypothetical protein